MLTGHASLQEELEDIETYAQPLSKISEKWGSDLERGLSDNEAKERLREYGLNLIPKIKPSFYRIYLAPFLNWLIDIYLIISIVLAFLAFFVLHEAYGPVTFWLSVISVNAVVAVVQEARAQKKMEALQKLSASKSKVVRKGRLLEIPSEQIVPGDIIRLEQGDRIPGDARIINASSLRVNEASLTGESEEVEKFEDDTPVEQGTPIPGRRDMVFLGTFVIAGTAKALITQTGRATQLGRIAGNMEGLDTYEIPLRTKVNRLAKYLGLAVLTYLSISLTYHITSLYLHNNLFVAGIFNTPLVARRVVESLITAMSIMPINIPFLITVVLLTGVLTMANKQVIIRDLNAVESLGRVSIVCSDKTGTITRNEMTVKWICLLSSRKDYLFGVTGVGFRPNGRIIEIDPDSSFEETIKKEPELHHGNEIEIGSETPLEYLIVSGLLNNDSTITKGMVESPDEEREEDAYRPLGDTTDASIVTLFHKSKLQEEIYRSRFQEAFNYPFDSNLKRTTRILRDNKNNRYAVFTKGATEILLPFCNYITKGVVTEVDILTDKERAQICTRADGFASSGYRVISFAFKYLEELPSASKSVRELAEDNLTYLGFVAIIDPPRKDVHESVLEAKSAGIKPVMITGDNLKTARSIAEQVGIAGELDLAVEGHEIQTLPDEDFLRTSVFARVTPEHKMSIVERYKRQDHVVVATGDGVNDALAISVADVGIAMGITGTDVAKEAADIVIADDSFNSIIRGIREGRGLFQKIRAIIFFYIAVNLAEALIYFGSSLIPSFHLLNMAQRIYIFTTAHTIPPLGIIVDRVSKDVMKEKPRDTEAILNKRLVIALLLFSASLGLMLYAVYFFTLGGTIPVFAGNRIGYVPDFNPNNLLDSVNWSQAKARTMLLTVIFVAECALVISLRRMNKSFSKILKEDNYWIIWPLILFVPLAHVLLMYVPAIQLFLAVRLGIDLELITLTWIDWIIAFAVGLTPIALLEACKYWVRKKRSNF